MLYTKTKDGKNMQIVSNSYEEEVVVSQKWAELEIGKSSVIPCTIPNIIDCNIVIFILLFIFYLMYLNSLIIYYLKLIFL